MIRIVVYRTSDYGGNLGIAEMFAALDKATAAGKRAGLEYKFAALSDGWEYWYEFETEEQAALFKLTYM